MFIVIKTASLRLQASNGKFVSVPRYVDLETALQHLRANWKYLDKEGKQAYAEVAEYLKQHPALLMAMDAVDDEGLSHFIEVTPF